MMMSFTGSVTKRHRRTWHSDLSEVWRHVRWPCRQTRSSLSFSRRVWHWRSPWNNDGGKFMNTEGHTVKAWRVLHWRTLQTRLLPPLQKTRRMTPECCRRLSGGSDKEETCGVRVTKEERVQKQKPSWHGCRYLAGGNCFVPLGHFLWLKDHLLIHQLSRTLHKGLDKTTATVSKTRERSGVVLIWGIFCLFSCNMFHCVYLNNDNISNSSKDWVIFTGFTNTLKID